MTAAVDRSEVGLEVVDGVAVITLDAPRRRNALTLAMARELVETVARVDADPRVRAAVVRGGGGHFCAGAHRALLDDVAEDPADPRRYADLGVVYESFHRLGRLGVPVVAAVRGAAVGAGVNLLLAADVRVVAENARIVAGFGAIGLHPGGGHLLLAATALGRSGAAAMTLLNQEIDGRRAAQAGLAWECVADDEVDARALALAAQAPADPELSRQITASFRRSAGPGADAWEQAMQAERAAQMWSLRRRAVR
ncbi:enoyl-CoA hydratase-related protein [Micromonospora sp. WMMD1128]|uniref:enoyl-CoA hydratase-related protein n=1 Tax=Micromonospora sp. WMMD1128 TaxID=3015150 RepID=UPI00248D2CC1|nr:enoyl-CoA hydratase-related protein [Micromonospora sp. WMMD1128]WBB75946.1 enoyl-CoA hydratase-related protein [Micromonospora sp. WMMD1128]